MIVPITRFFRVYHPFIIIVGLDGRGRNRLLLLRCKRRVQKVAVQPFTNLALFPGGVLSGFNVARLIRVRVQSIPTQQQAFSACFIIFEYDPFNDFLPVARVIILLIMTIGHDVAHLGIGFSRSSNSKKVLIACQQLINILVTLQLLEGGISLAILPGIHQALRRRVISFRDFFRTNRDLCHAAAAAGQRHSKHRQ